MKTVKQMSEDMANEPTRPSAGHTTKAMSMADKMCAPVKKAKGGKVSSASKRADGCAIRGKTRGRMV